MILDNNIIICMAVHNVSQLNIRHVMDLAEEMAFSYSYSYISTSCVSAL